MRIPSLGGRFPFWACLILGAGPLISAEPAKVSIEALHQQWKAERDPAARKDLAGKLVDAMSVEEEPQGEIADELSRDGLPPKLIPAPSQVTAVTLEPLIVLKGARAVNSDFPPSPVLRRITADRVEAWTRAAGWLFDGTGQVVAQVKVPRRDGKGREWFGAFLADGTWITTDIWENDRQLNAYSPKGKWRWEFTGEDMLKRLRPAKRGDAFDLPLIGWARADRTGQKWLVSIGSDFSREFLLLDAKKNVLTVEGKSLWQVTYPRAMGPRGMYIMTSIDSDDGRTELRRTEAPHGSHVGWPQYWFGDRWDRVLLLGAGFGFWPGSNHVYLEKGSSAQETWFFDGNGKYEGQVGGFVLGDSATAGNLLVQDAGGRVLEVVPGKNGPAVVGGRSFLWADGSVAIPLEIYDDLKLGFFLRGPGLTGKGEENGEARKTAEIVWVRWK